jgi:8-amino-7-oxononanoate synthase
MPDLDAFAQQKIATLAAQGRLRSPVTAQRIAGGRVMRNSRELVDFCSNDYLGLSLHPDVVAASQRAAGQYGAGAGASRLISGNLPLYNALEAALAEWKHTESACVFGSGYMANLGCIGALIGRHDLILADKLAHACMLDGAALSGAKLLRFAHNDAEDCARLLKKYRNQHTHCLVITETVFSMDGDIAPLADLRHVCEAHDAWLMTDDAHGIGLVNSPAHIQMGTLSKALGAYGGYVCGSATLVDYLKTAARSLIFTTALPPATLAAALQALTILRRSPELAQQALQHAQDFCKAMGLPAAQSQIVPWVLGGESKVMEAANMLESAGYMVGAIRPPTVPKNTARLRFSFSSSLQEYDVTNLVKAINNAGIGS